MWTISTRHSCLFTHMHCWIYKHCKRSSDTRMWHSETDPCIFTKCNSRNCSQQANHYHAIQPGHASSHKIHICTINSCYINIWKPFCFVGQRIHRLIPFPWTDFALYLSKVLANKIKVILWKTTCQSVNEKLIYSNYYCILIWQNYPGNDLLVLHR